MDNTIKNATANDFSIANQAFWLVGNYTGSGQGPYAEIGITETGENLAVGAALTGLRIDYTYGGPGTGAGNRIGQLVILNHNGPTPDTNNDSLKFYLATFGQTYIRSSDGGTPSAPKGDAYGIAALAQMEPGATHWNQICGAELDVAVKAGASVAYKSVLTLISVDNDAVQGSLYDAMLGFTRDETTSIGFRFGVAFGRQDSLWPIAPDGTLIGSVAPAGDDMRVAKNGIDLRNIKFSEFAFVSDNFAVTGDGAMLSKADIVKRAVAPEPIPGQFCIYMDAADDKLKAIGPNGTVTILASP